MKRRRSFISPSLRTVTGAPPHADDGDDDDDDGDDDDGRYDGHKLHARDMAYARTVELHTADGDVSYEYEVGVPAAR